MNKATVRQIVNVIITIAVIVINVLANALPLNGLNTGEISDRFKIYFVPAGYVFSIWGVIYLGLIAFAIYQALPAQRNNPHVARISYAYAISGIANIVWIFFWHYEVFTLTLIPMLVILGSLIFIFLRLWQGRSEQRSADRWAIALPFNIYLGWISVATVANATQLLYYLEWGGWGIAPEIWALIMLIVAAAIAIAMVLRHRNIAYAMVFVWAYIGIAVQHSKTALVAFPAGILAALIALSVVMAAPLKRSTRS
ncbi:MAG: tryptophan-rich sensory protein [Anaerolineae bacterium]|nr:tryptophan-rich sensory protein [Anaerolineae bacterium]